MIVMILSSVVLFAQKADKDNLTELYIATFDRAPDIDGINYWLNSNFSLEDITRSFFDQTETKEKYPDRLSTDEFIVEIYKNLFKRAPDSDGQKYWRDGLDSGSVEKSTFILASTNGAKGDDETILSNKKEIGLYFMQHNLNDANLSKEVMREVTHDMSTVDDAKRKIDSYTSDNPSSDACSIMDHNNGKTSFDGRYVKVDSLGNVCIKESGIWRSFFPMIIYPASATKRPNYADYTVGGRFNTMIAYEVGQMVEIKEAGMKSLLNSDMYQDGAHFEGEFQSALQEIKSKNLMDNLLFYYTDYEGVRIGAWDWHDEKRAIIDIEDPNGHPSYFLNGNPPYNPHSAEKVYLDGHQTSDILGAGVYERWNDLWVNGPDRFIQLGLGVQTNPVVIAQIAYGVGGDQLDKYPRDPVGHRFTPIAMSAVAQGAKGVGFWQDWGEEVGVAVESNAWWDDLPKFNADIKKMMRSNIVQSIHNPFEIICNSHIYRDHYGHNDENSREIILDNIYKKDEWGYYLIADDHLSVSIGTRVVDGVGYAIISNWNDKTENFECSVNTSQMGYTFSKLYDFIDDKDGVGSVVGDIFKISVPAYSWVVLKFVP